MTLEVVKYGHPALRQRGENIPSITPGIRELAEDMLETMYDARGVGLAAQQVGRALDTATLNVLGKGARNVEILKQNLHDPYKVEDQIAILFCGTKGLLMDVPVKKIREFEAEFLEFIKMKYPEMMVEMSKGQITEATEKLLTTVVTDMTAKYRK